MYISITWKGRAWRTIKANRKIAPVHMSFIFFILFAYKVIIFLSSSAKAHNLIRHSVFIYLSAISSVYYKIVFTSNWLVSNFLSAHNYVSGIFQFETATAHLTKWSKTCRNKKFVLECVCKRTHWSWLHDLLGICSNFLRYIRQFVWCCCCPPLLSFCLNKVRT